jgi:hypothetical protein
MSLRLRILVVVYQEEGLNGEKHYASIPVPSKYKVRPLIS